MLTETLDKNDTITFPALILMLVSAFLLLFNAGFDHNVIYWLLLPLTTVSIFLVSREKLILEFNIRQPSFWYFLFLLWSGLSIIWSLNAHRTLVEFLQLSLYGIVFVIASSLDREQIPRVGRIVLITGFGVAIFGLSQYLIIEDARLESTMANANVLGIFLVMFFLSGWSFYLRKNNLYLAIICITLLATLPLTASRGSFIIFALTLPIIFIGMERSALKGAIIKTVLCIALSLLITQALMFFAPYIQETLGKSNELTQILTRRSSFVAWSGVSRFAFWQAGINIFANHPLIGTGLGTFSLGYNTVYVEEIWFSRFVHNHYIQSAAELGIIGFALLGGFMLTMIFKVLRILKSERQSNIFPGLLAASVAFLIHIGGDFGWNFPAVTTLFFMMCGFIVNLSRDKKKMSLNQGFKAGAMIILLLLFMLTAWQYAAVVLYRQGITADNHNETAVAAGIYDQANNIYPINSMAYSFAANAYYRMAKDKENSTLMEMTIKRAEKAVALSPVDANLHNNLGHLYWEVGRIKEAEFHLSKAVDYAAYRLNHFIDLGIFYLQHGKAKEAETVLRRAEIISEYAIGMHPTEEDRQRVDRQVFVLNQLLEEFDQD